MATDNKFLAAFKQSLEDIQATFRGPGRGIYSDIVEMLDRQEKIAAARAEGNQPTKPELEVIQGDDISK